MALQYAMVSPQHVLKHRLAFAAVLAQLPAAVEARHRARAARPPTPPSVFILDWDDTCCPTSMLERMGFMADLDSSIDRFAPDQARLLRVLETRVLSLLKTAVDLGTVLIVTNAGEGWVELSSSRFLPAVREFLKTHYNRVTVISARARYVDVYREHPLQWKALTFADELCAIDAKRSPSEERLHVVVLGDSVGDQYAAHVASNNLAAANMPVVLKVIKFLERPSIDQLCKELGVLLDHLPAMTLYRGPFDLSMYKEHTPTQQHNQAQQMRHHQLSQQSKAAAVEHRQAQALQPTATISNSAVDTQHAPISPVSAMATCSAAV